MARRLSKARLALIALAAVLGGHASAQNDSAEAEDLTQPPPIDDGPGASRLQLPERPTELEEVIVISESEWRLPDLGSTWRQEQKEATDTGRIAVAFLPLFDPERIEPDEDLFPRRREERGVGFIELFRIEFGDR